VPVNAILHGATEARGISVSGHQAFSEGFPYVIRGFHADNDSEYANDQIANLLEKQMATHYEKLKSLPIISLDL
jgi:hypothetical protein